MSESAQTPIEELLRMSSRADGWKTYSERGEGVLLESQHHNDLHDLAASEIETLRARVSGLSDAAALCQRNMESAEARCRELEGVVEKADALHNGILLCSVTPMRNQDAIDNLTNAYGRARAAMKGEK